MEKICTSDLPAISQIEYLFRNNFKYFTEYPSVAAVIFSESLFQNDSLLSQEGRQLLSTHEKALSCAIRKGQMNGDICKIISEKEMIRILIGSARYIVTQWRLSSYSFDLISEGNLMLASLKKLLSPDKQ